MRLYKKVSGSKGREKKKEKGGAEGQSVVVLYKMGQKCDVWTGKDE